ATPGGARPGPDEGTGQASSRRGPGAQAESRPEGRPGGPESPAPSASPAARPAGGADLDELAEQMNRILREQARRRGVPLY
ncbi:MAG TPA: hypothetical protein VNK05_06385, partial [Chloroflexota bacterium]|nr:hypothetical protein [Chloroflexota bacterium]